MKICMITSSYPRFKGDFAGVFVKSLAEAIAKKGNDVHVLAAFDPEVVPEVGESQVKIQYFPYALSKRMHMLGYARSLRNDAKLKRLAAAIIPVYLASAAVALLMKNLVGRFDVIHAHWVIPSGLSAALASALLRIPLVVSVHGSDIFVAESNRAYGAAAGLAFKAARAVVACSDDLRGRATALGARPGKTVTVPYGVDMKTFGDLPASYRIPAYFADHRGDPIVLAAGRLVGKKGFRYLVEAVPSVLDVVPTARFVFVGDGDERQALVNLARRLKIEERVSFVGSVPWSDMPAHLSACDAFVVPSVHDSSGNVDGLPNTLLEAMAAGKPIIASRVAGIPQAITEGVNGLLVAEKSPEEIGAAIIKVLTDTNLSERLGKAARDKARDSFSWDAAAAAYIRIYESLAAG